MSINLEAKILRYELATGIVSCEDVSLWAYKKISDMDCIPDEVLDLSLSPKIGVEETIRLLISVGGSVKSSDAIKELYAKLLGIASESVLGARKVSSYLAALCLLHDNINGVDISYFESVFQEAELGYVSKGDIQKEIITYLKSSIEKGIDL